MQLHFQIDVLIYSSTFTPLLTTNNTNQSQKKSAFNSIRQSFHPRSVFSRSGSTRSRVKNKDSCSWSHLSIKTTPCDVTESNKRDERWCPLTRFMVTTTHQHRHQMLILFLFLLLLPRLFGDSGEGRFPWMIFFTFPKTYSIAARRLLLSYIGNEEDWNGDNGIPLRFLYFLFLPSPC